MPRYRKLHTKITESFDVNEMPDDFTRLLWTWLMLGADREGRMPDNPALVKAKVMPLRADVSNEQVAAALDWYADHDMITRYMVDGRRFFFLTHFAEMQGDTRKEAASVYPDPPSFNSDASQEQVESDARPAQEQRNTDSGTEAATATEAAAATATDAAAVVRSEYEQATGRLITQAQQIVELDRLTDSYGQAAMLEAIAWCRMRKAEDYAAGKNKDPSWFPIGYIRSRIEHQQQDGKLSTGPPVGKPGATARAKRLLEQAKLAHQEQRNGTDRATPG
jgi:hypothetical protein